MKNILFAFLLISASVTAQDKKRYSKQFIDSLLNADTLIYRQKQRMLFADTGIIFEGHQYDSLDIVAKVDTNIWQLKVVTVITPFEDQDTIPVKLLVSNWQQDGGIIWIDEPEYKVYGIDGYSVRKWVDAHMVEIKEPGSIGYFYVSAAWVHSHYIGSDKKPLPKSIIVWQVK